MSREFLRFNHANPPSDPEELPGYLNETFIELGAVVELLRDGTVRGAGLDVFEEEPKLAHGLPELANVVVTPHIASGTEETRGKMSEMAASNIAEFLAGNPPPNPVT